MYIYTMYALVSIHCSMRLLDCEGSKFVKVMYTFYYSFLWISFTTCVMEDSSYTSSFPLSNIIHAHDKCTVGENEAHH